LLACFKADANFQGDIMLIEHTSLARTASAILEGAGAPRAHADAVAHHLVEANLKGHDSHGVGMIPSYVKGMVDKQVDPNRHAKIIKDNNAIVSVDGGTGLGRIVGFEAMDIGIERTKNFGIGCVALGNAAHLGRIGAFAEYCADQGLVSMHYVNVVGHDPMVVAFGGRDRRFITNPYCCAVPRPNGEHVVLDMATTTVAAGKVRVAHMKGAAVPSQSLVDENGLETTDPGVIFGSNPTGAMQPFGGHKGYGLMVICELLGGALGGVFTMQPEHPRRGATLNNMLSIMIDPEAVGDLASFDQEVGAMMDYIYASTPAEGVDHVRLPGDPEKESAATRMANGIEIDPNSWNSVLNSAEHAGLDRDSIAALAHLLDD
jgi:uncharacterized oxidoreductase